MNTQGATRKAKETEVMTWWRAVDATLAAWGEAEALFGDVYWRFEKGMSAGEAAQDISVKRTVEPSKALEMVTDKSKFGPASNPGSELPGFRFRSENPTVSSQDGKTILIDGTDIHVWNHVGDQTEHHHFRLRRV